MTRSFDVPGGAIVRLFRESGNAPAALGADAASCDTLPLDPESHRQRPFGEKFRGNVGFRSSNVLVPIRHVAEEVTKGVSDGATVDLADRPPDFGPKISPQTR